MVSLGIAIDNKDDLEPESKYMALIATLMGMKWSSLLARILARLHESAVAGSRRALLSPIGEIA